MGNEVKVLGAWACPYNHRVELALKLKKVPYERITEDIWNMKPLFVDQSPLIPVFKKDIPVLVHNGKPIAESFNILLYIEETFDGYPLLPEDPHERAYARMMAKFIDDKFIPSFRTACWCEGEEQKKCMEQTKENLSVIEKEIKGKRYFGGDVIGFVDIFAAYVAFWTEIVQEVNGVKVIDEENYPNIMKWSNEFLRLDVVKESLPDKERLTGLYRSVKQTLLAKNTAAN